VVLVNDKIDRASRTCRVRVAVDNPDRTLRPGQFVHVAFPLRSSRGHVVVSRRALAWEGGQPQVFVLREGRVAVRRVRLGLDDGERVEVLEGLEPGEEVVTDDPGVLADGMRVQVRAEPVR
jgi:RND family efflux transporter MFP subunit